MAQYRDITAKAKVIEDINVDCWGALFYIVVNDFPDLRAGRLSPVGKFRFSFSCIIFIGNLFVQAILLFFICKLLMMPGILEAQTVYKRFMHRAFSDGALDVS